MKSDKFKWVGRIEAIVERNSSGRATLECKTESQLENFRAAIIYPSRPQEKFSHSIVIIVVELPFSIVSNHPEL